MASEPYNSDMESVTDRVFCDFESMLCPTMRWPTNIPKALAKWLQLLTSSQCVLPHVPIQIVLAMTSWNFIVQVFSLLPQFYLPDEKRDDGDHPEDTLSDEIP